MDLPNSSGQSVIEFLLICTVFTSALVILEKMIHNKKILNNQFKISQEVQNEKSKKMDR